MLSKIVKHLDHNKVPNPKRVVLLGSINGGTTAISKCMLQHPDVTVRSNSMKIPPTTRLNIGHLRFYYGGAPTKVLYDKEPIGRLGLSLWPDYLPREDFPNIADVYVMVLYRDPVFVWNSWQKRGYRAGLDLMVRSYHRLHEYHSKICEREISHIPICFENFLQNPEQYLQRVCEDLSIEYNDGMCNWSVPWGNRLGKTENKNIDKEPLKKSVDHNLIIPESDVHTLESELGEIYTHALENY